MPRPCARACRGAERLAWALIGSGVLAWSLGEIYYTAVLWTDPDPPIPSLADAGYLLFPPLTLAGLFALLRSRVRGVPRRLWVDGVTAALGVAALSAAIVFETVLDSVEGAPLAIATGLAYPLLDLVLLGIASAPSPAPAGASTARGCCWPPASAPSGSPTRSTSSAPPRASTSPAAGSTPAGGSASP